MQSFTSQVGLGNYLEGPTNLTSEQAGGLMGLWLGVSVMTLLQAFIYLFAGVHEFIRRLLFKPFVHPLVTSAPPYFLPSAPAKKEIAILW
jgi:hypothetical protein